MSRVRVVLTVVLLWAWPATGQTPGDESRSPKRSGSVAHPSNSDGDARTYGIEDYSPLAAAGGYRRHRGTFWEFWWHRFNPRNINYGAWIEQRRQVFLGQAGANRYFWFAFWEFAGICFLLLWAAKERMDRKDTEWEAAECLADLANYADYCRRQALEAIQHHNDHIEVCNRVIESNETGRPVGAGGNGEREWKAEAEKLSSELAQRIADNTKLAAQLEQKTATVTDLSARIDQLARTQNAKVDGPSNMDLVGRVNRLTGEVQALRQENIRLKRENQNAGSGDRVR